MDKLREAGLVAPDEKKENTGEHEAPASAPRSRSLPPALGGTNASSPLSGVTFAPMAPATGFAGFNTVATPDEEIVNGLTQATAKAQGKGYDKFLTNLKTLEGMPDAQRYQMALKLTQANFNISPAQVLASIDDCLAAVENEKAGFENALASETKSKVTDVQAQVQAKVEQIAKLNEEIQKLSGQAQAEQARIAGEASKFEASFAVVKTGFETEHQRVASLTTSTK